MKNLVVQMSDQTVWKIPEKLSLRIELNTMQILIPNKAKNLIQSIKKN